MTGLRPSPDHTIRLHQVASLALAGAREPVVLQAVGELACTTAEWRAEVVQRVLEDFAYIPDHGDRLPSVRDVIAAGGDDCDGLAVLAAALGVAAGLPVVLELYKQPWDRDATHVAARVGGVLIDPTPQPLFPWELTEPGPLVLFAGEPCCEACA